MTSKFFKVLSVFLILLGVVLIALCVLYRVDFNQYSASSAANYTVGFVSDTRLTEDSDIIDKLYRKIQVQYVVEGEVIISEVSVILPKYQVNDSVDVYYQSLDRTSCRIDTGTSYLFTAGIISAVLIILGLFILIKDSIKASRIEKLMVESAPVDAVIYQVFVDSKLVIGKKKPFRIKLYKKNAMGTKDIYISESFWENPLPIIHERRIETLPVYVNSKNPKIHFVDLRPILDPESAVTPTQPPLRSIM